MTKQSRKLLQRRVRSISTKRDFEGAAAIVKRLADKSERDAAAELRLQLLIEELDKFDTSVDDVDGDLAVDEDSPELARRRSDESSGSE